MRLAEWVRRLTAHPGLNSLLTSLEGTCAWRSVAPEARPVLLAAAYDHAPRKTLIVTASYERALHWQAKLALCGVPQGYLYQLPSGSSALFEDALPEHIALSDRLGGLRALVDDGPCVVIGSPQAVLERTLPRDLLIDAFVSAKPGDTVEPEILVRRLARLGYERAEPVRLPGQFSQRGGILDVYPTGRDLPVRLEFFGDQIESLRTFDPNSQRSTGSLPALAIAPSRETLFTERDEGLADLVASTIHREAAALDEEGAARLEELVGEDAESLRAHRFFDRLDLYRPMLHPESGCALDLLGPDDLVVLDEPLELESIATRTEEELGQALHARAERGEILASLPNDFLLPPEHLGSPAGLLVLSAMNSWPGWLSVAREEEVGASSLDPYRGRPE
ncbi:MAG: hypothetical protein HYR64_00120, partial [Fimbriimonas ginsengisoli]|nr:hypothetical protein [Fimbriimonas ginsengisoli]